MTKAGQIALLVVGLAFGLYNCTPKSTTVTSQAIAEVGNKILTQSQLERIMPSDFASKEDSVEFVNDYINKWIKQQLFVAEAEKNLSNQELDVSNELEEYRQELIIHKYKNKKFNTQNSLNVTDAEVEKYYREHANLFVLEYPIVQVNYIIFPVEIELPKNFKQQLVSSKKDDRIACEDFIFKYAKKYDDFSNNWIYLQQFTDIGNLEVKNPDKFLQQNNLIEFEKDSELHIIYIKAFKLPGNQAPVEFVTPRITSLIANEKKLDFLRQFKDSLYNAALKYNKFRVFNQ